MRTLSLCISLFLLFTNCNSTQTDDIPSITIDDKHYNLRAVVNGVIPTENYKIKACSSFIIDATKYDFSILKKMNNGNLPDMIQIITKNGTFAVDLDTENEITVDEKSAINIGGHEIFSGLQPKEKALISIGTLQSVNENIEFKSFYTTFIEVE